MKHYGRFVLMICGKSREWAESRLSTVCRLLETSTGGIPSLWIENQDRTTFCQKLTSIMDAIVFHALSDVNFEDGIFSSCSESASVSSSYSPSSDILEDLETERISQEENTSVGGVGALWKRVKSQEGEPVKLQPTKSNEHSRQTDEEAVFAHLHREFAALPSAALPKSGVCAFLRAQQLLETCQQYSGVLAGATFFHNRVLNTQVEADLQLILTSFNDVQSEGNDILQKQKPQFQLPGSVTLHHFNLPQRALKDIVKSIPKISTRRGERRGLHSEVQSSDLSSLRSALQNQSLQSYPSSIPPLFNKRNPSDEPQNASETGSQTPYKGTMDPLQLCAKINKSGDLLNEGRPSQSLPGTPRKIRVATMLPEVGSDSPELRYKVLTARKPKPGSSSHNTPRKLTGTRNGNVVKSLDGQSNGPLHRGSNLTAPSLKRKEFLMKTDHKLSQNGGILDQNSQMDKENINSLCQNQLGSKVNKELNIKNTKNKLNLQFAPEKVNRPSETQDEGKISREINGNLSKDNIAKECLGSKGSFKSQLIDLNDDDEESRSEESEISILELSSFIESRENGNRLFEEATRIDSPANEFSESNGDLADESCAELDEQQAVANEHQWTRLTLYTQKYSSTILYLIVDNRAASNQMLIYNLYRLAATALLEIEHSVMRTLEISEEKVGDTFLQKTHSVLSAFDLPSLNLSLTSVAHRSFCNYPDVAEITIRDEETVLWAHKNCHTETFYQSSGVCRPGLPIPSDVMARIAHRARRRLERDHGITVL